MAVKIKAVIDKIFNRLLEACGPRDWWPGEGRDEIIIGAVLTQNTAWKNVEQALRRLRDQDLISLKKMALMQPEQIAPLIVPAGYFNLKARRLHCVASFFAPNGRERFGRIARWDDRRLREELLGVWGVGPETADSIMLYALGRLTFVVDAYTLRVVERHGLMDAENIAYEPIREMFTRHVAPDLQLFNEYHALLVWVGHHYCKPRPRCTQCPLSRRDCFASSRAWGALEPARAEKELA